MIIKTANFVLPLSLFVVILFSVGCRNQGNRVNSSTENIAEQSNQSQNISDTVATEISEVQKDTDNTVMDDVRSNNSESELLGDSKHIRLDTIKLDIASNGRMWLDTLHYLIPQVVAIAPEYNAVANSINKQIMKLLDYDPNSATPIEIMNCLSIEFEYEYQHNYLLLSYTIVNFGAHGDVENYDSQLFDLETGECIEQHSIPFSALFSIKGYFDFLNSRNWSEGVRKSFEEEYRRMNADDEDPMDEKKLQEEIDEKCNDRKFHICYSFDKDEFRFARESDYYSVMAWAIRCFEPQYGDYQPLKDMQLYLSDVGKQLLNENYFTLSTIDRILLRNKLWNQIEDYMFFELNDADNTCIAVNYQDRQNVWGYLYGKDKVGIDLKGVFNDGDLILKTENDSVLTIHINAYKEFREQIAGYSDKTLPY